MVPMAGVDFLLGKAMVVIDPTTNWKTARRGLQLGSVVALFTGILALCLAVAAFFHIPIIKFPTEWELERMDMFLEKMSELPANEAKELKLSIQKVRHNHQSISHTLNALRQRATLGFLALSVLGFFIYGMLRRSQRETGAPAGGTPSAAPH